MKLIFSDDFDYEGKPNPNKWKHETGGHWQNNEIQYYTDDIKNAYVKDGKLYLMALLENKAHRRHTSARLTTYGKFSFQYGKIEMRARLPKGKGSWPAFWMLPDSIHQGTSWPLCGEIDIVEFAYGADKEALHFSLHSQLYNHTKNTQETFIEKFTDLTENFNTFTCVWKEDEISYYLNNEHVVTFFEDKKLNGEPKVKGEESWPFKQPYHILLNLAVGGMFGGDVEDADLPYIYEIDYVRVWEF